VQPQPLRSRVALALDNAVEGCVRESFGALVAQFQAEHATDDEVRRAMARIADDETRHAELSWALHAWLWSGLDETERAVVREAQLAAAARLRHELEAPVAAALTTVAGIPTTQTSLSLFDAVASQLWS
jgi:hypothetical protein